MKLSQQLRGFPKNPHIFSLSTLCLETNLSLSLSLCAAFTGQPLIYAGETQVRLRNK